MNLSLKVGSVAVALSVSALTAQANQLIESFEAGADRRWGYVQDGVMGGVSQGQLSFASEGDTSYARLTGTVSTDNNGGFIQFRAGIAEGLPDWTQALRLRVKGNRESYFVFIRTTDRRRPWHSYRARFETTDEWRDVDLPLADFTPSQPSLPPDLKPQKLVGIGIVAYGKDFEADLSESEIHLLRGESS